MNAKLHVALFLVSIQLLSQGCAVHKPENAQAQKPAPAVNAQQVQDPIAAPAPAPGTPEAGFNAADSLARRSDEYARSMEAALVARQATKGKPIVPPPTVGAPQSSSVQWMDPGGLALGNEPANRDPVPLSNAPVRKPNDAPVERAPIEAAPAHPNAPADASTAAAVIPHPSEPAPGFPHPAAPGIEGKLYKRISEYPRDVSGHLDYQLLHFLLDEQVPLLASLAALPGEDRELVAAVIDGLSNFRSNLRSDNNMLLSKKVRPLLEMSDRLRAQAELSIGTIALCNSVKTFGVYEPLDPPRFVAGKNNDVILYCEVDNFSSQLNDQRMWETKLTQETVVYAENGQPVWSDRPETLVDRSRSRRHDFFVNKVLRMPPTLGIGRFLLKVSIIDQNANRVAERTIPVVIVAQ